MEDAELLDPLTAHFWALGTSSEDSPARREYLPYRYVRDGYWTTLWINLRGRSPEAAEAIRRACRD